VLFGGKIAIDVCEMNEAGVDALQARDRLAGAFKKFLDAEVGKCAAAAKNEHADRPRCGVKGARILQESGGLPPPERQGNQVIDRHSNPRCWCAIPIQSSSQPSASAKAARASNGELFCSER